MAGIGNRPTQSNHFPIDVEIANFANGNGATVTISFNRATRNLLSLHKSTQRIRRLLAARVFGAVLIPTALAVFRRINSVQSDISFAPAQRIAIHDMHRSRTQIKQIKLLS